MVSNNHDDIFLQAMQAEEKTSEENYGPVKKGTVVQLTETDAFLDLGGKSEAVVPLDEFTEKPKIGDVIPVILKEMKDGVHQASYKAAERFSKQDDVYQAYKEELPVKGKIVEIVKKDDQPKGFKVDLGMKINAFLPLSHIDTRKFEKLEEMIGQEYEFSVIEMKRNNVTVSRRQYLRKTVKKVYTSFFETHQVGQRLTGAVDEVEQNYLIMSTEGIKAFLHISDFSWKYLNDLKKVVKRGDELEVEIISLDPAKDSVKVSKKLLMPNPWDTIESQLHLGDTISAKVVRFRRDGAVVEVEDGVEGFLPTDEMSWTQKTRDPKKIVKIGDMVTVKVKNLEADKKRLDVSLKEIQSNPWDNAEANYTHGRKLTGVISSILDFGVFVRFDDGIEGLLRKEDVDWMEAEVDLKQRFKKGDTLDVVVLSLEAGKEKLRLGIKQMSDNPYKSFSLNYPKGSAVEATVKALVDNGAEVDLGNDLTGFIHISNLSKNKIDKAEEAVQVGAKIKALVKFCDVAKQKIELSIKDFEMHEEHKEVKQFIVEDHSNESHSTSMGALLAEQFKNLKVGDEKPKKAAKPAKETEVKEEKAPKAAKAKKKSEETAEEA